MDLDKMLRYIEYRKYDTLRALDNIGARLQTIKLIEQMFDDMLTDTEIAWKSDY